MIFGSACDTGNITSRAALAALTAFAASLMIGRRLIPMLNVWHNRCWREKFFARHQLLKDETKVKDKTPAMGGIIFISALLVTSLIWVDMFNNYVQCVIFSMVALSCVGFVDDWIKLTTERDGISAKRKFLLQSAIGGAIGLALYLDNYIAPGSGDRSSIYLPFVGLAIGIGPLYVAWCAFIVNATSNSTNLTDGVDGLAIGVIIIMAIALGALACITGSPGLSGSYSIPYIQKSSELVVLIGGFVGAGLGFLTFNTYPAKVFMGDTGSLGLGGMIGSIALILRHEMILPIIGVILIVECGSVIIQVFCFKMYGYRPFAMAPFHHHVKRKYGWHEQQITTRFWTITLLAIFLCMSFVKS